MIGPKAPKKEIEEERQKILKNPRIEGEKIKVASILKSTLSADHRVLDGTVAAKLLKDFNDIIENPFEIWIDSNDLEII